MIVSSLSGGGAEHVARKNLEILLHEKDFDVAVLTCDKALWDQYPVKHYLAKDFRKVRGPGKVFATMGIPENYKMTARCLQEFRPDIIHLHNYIPFSPSMLRALKEYKEKCGCKVILTHHTYSYICTNDSLYNYSQDKICEKCIGTFDTTILRDNCAKSLTVCMAKYLQKNEIWKHLKSLVDIHISPSHFLKNMLLKVDPALEIYIIRNPCIPEVYPHKNSNRKNQIVYFGRIDREKNIIEFLRLFLKEKFDLDLLIIGDGPCADELEAFLSDHKTKRVIFLRGFLSTEKLYKLIQNAKFFVLPSVWYENSPVSIVEAVNLGLVPLVSNIGGMRELTEVLGIGECFDPMDQRNISETVWRAIKCFEQGFYNDNDRKNLECFTNYYYHQEILPLYCGN